MKRFMDSKNVFARTPYITVCADNVFQWLQLFCCSHIRCWALQLQFYSWSKWQPSDIFRIY